MRSERPERDLGLVAAEKLRQNGNADAAGDGIEHGLRLIALPSDIRFKSVGTAQISDPVMQGWRRGSFEDHERFVGELLGSRSLPNWYWSDLILANRVLRWTAKPTAAEEVEARRRAEAEAKRIAEGRRQSGKTPNAERGTRSDGAKTTAWMSAERGRASSTCRRDLPPHNRVPARTRVFLGVSKFPDAPTPSRHSSCWNTAKRACPRQAQLHGNALLPIERQVCGWPSACNRPVLLALSYSELWAPAVKASGFTPEQHAHRVSLDAMWMRHLNWALLRGRGN